ncbi:uncharacterized protein LOC129588935 [Paramacrobiotus metropolitanus]|uniref:uncharacterized protein LOC129588935 n=1 Tax=Paramacrobiotus metropolitanus TaxID=2943436 RepID=UPI0024459ED6|nr:uncharacterized protein LOC129588935 [Paramacrobiotus metropolitanus]
MPLRAHMNAAAFPLQHESTITFSDHDEEPTAAREDVFSGPAWNHQKSFYTDRPRVPVTPSHAPRPFTYTPPNFRPSLPKPASAPLEVPPEVPKPPEVRPLPSVTRGRSAQRPEMSLGETIEVYVDDKFYTTHNIHYGPAVIRIGEEGTAASREDGFYRPASSASVGSSAVEIDGGWERSSSAWEGSRESGRGSTGRGSYPESRASGASIITI